MASTWNFGIIAYAQNKKDGKDQETVQSSTIPDPEHHMGK